jgi:hypothetical protein
MRPRSDPAPRSAKVGLVRECPGAPENLYQRLVPGGAASLAEYLDWVVETAHALPSDEVSPRSPSEAIDAVRRLQLTESFYLHVELEALSPRLARDVMAPPMFSEPPKATIFWCGIMGTSSGLHRDVLPNCNVQVAGRKHFCLFRPRAARRLRSGAWFSAHCAFDPNAPDYDRYPDARYLDGLECTLSPGEGIYIPVGWYHQVTTTSSWAANVNFFWRRPWLVGLETPSLWPLLWQMRMSHGIRREVSFR